MARKVLGDKELDTILDEYDDASSKNEPHRIVRSARMASQRCLELRATGVQLDFSHSRPREKTCTVVVRRGNHMEPCGGPSVWSNEETNRCAACMPKPPGGPEGPGSPPQEPGKTG